MRRTKKKKDSVKLVFVRQSHLSDQNVLSVASTGLMVDGFIKDIFPLGNY